MDYKKLIASAMVFSVLAASAGCGEKESSSEAESVNETTIADTTVAEDTAAEEETTEAATEELVPPVPSEATDDNAITFDDDDFSFAEVVTDDDYAATGELSVVEVQGNKMLKFTDSGEIALDGKVQKIKIHANQLIGAENLDKVNYIEFDVYGDATADKLVNELGENVKAPGWIGGGGGTVIADGETWYDFSEYSGGEYNFDMSGAVHVKFKFLLAAGGHKWSNEMEDANFLIMRWGIQNESNLYIDNIVFYDEEGNSLPIVKE